MKKLLILGGSGLVGSSLVKELKNYYDIYATYYKNYINISSINKIKFEIGSSDASIKEMMTTIHPEIVISCIKGDFNDQYKNHVQIAKYLSETNGKLYFCSTSNVFDGDPTKVHYENDTCCPESDYGKFKYKCENALKKILNDNLCIIRLPAIWGKNSKRLNSLKNMLENGKDIEVYCNLFRTTNTDTMLAKQINYIVTNNLSGIFHLASVDVVNYYDFISKLIIKLGYKNKKINKIRLPEEKYFLALGSIRNELPDYFRISNKDVINYLAS